jgi:hypothetical protein
MGEIYKEIEDNIKELISLDNKTKKKDVIKRLAKNLETAIKQDDPRIINLLQLLEKPKQLDSVVDLIKWIIKDKQLDIGDTTLYDSLDDKYKKEREKTGEAKIVRLSDNFIKEHTDELLERIKTLNKGAAKDIKIKIKKDTIDLQGWNSLISLELVELAKKIDETEETDKELEKEIAERLRMVRDARFATTWSRYEAIVAAVNTTKSLTNAIDEEYVPLKREIIINNEHNCDECYCDGEPKNSCKCHCHRTTQDMTTKGLKWAVKHNKRLGEFDEHMKRIGNTDHDDICPAIKTLFTNPNMDKHLSSSDKMNLLTKHIEKEQCIRCEMFLDDHPEFFKSDK